MLELTGLIAARDDAKSDVQPIPAGINQGRIINGSARSWLFVAAKRRAQSVVESEERGAESFGWL